MTDEPEADDGPESVLADPRIDPDHCRLARGAGGDAILLVGTVHDHPASAYRVRAAIETLTPDIVAVELPGLAVSLFEAVGRRADDVETVGEMSVGLAASAEVGARRVGIDTLDTCFARNLARELRETSPSAGTLRRVLGGVSTVGRHAVSCRISAAFGRTEAATPATRQAYDYEIGAGTSPSEQAAHERRQLSRSLSVLRAFERPVADAVVDRARERTMAGNLLDLRDEGSVVAVVGFDHLDEVADRLADECERVGRPDRTDLTEPWRDGAAATE